ncbi:hypothetical protein T12_3024 [Trichinella patagoniensis]|uniref:Uncharacterized protein n=1 Tax=Trichinella patagoniensis TaxID=990121 RepID=A0A0V0YWW6_9BILA|nr:hypothetical protein T12_3024 [Trichinella patagoniensis]
MRFRHVVFSDKSDNRNPSNYEGVEETTVLST